MSLSFKRIKRKLRNIIWRLFFFKEVSFFENSNKISFIETLETISEKKLSMARFGDGEIGLMFMQPIKFQKSSPELSADLRSVLSSNSDQVLICLPTFLQSPIQHENTFWTNFWCEHWKRIKPLLNTSTCYGETQISRPECFAIHQSQAVEAWKKIWNNRDVCFVTGEGSRFDTEHMLFNNIKNKQTIYSLPENAYNDIERLIDIIQSQIPKSCLILCALGPTSTVLAYKLAHAGYQILDIGHLPNSYERVFNNGLSPEQISYKKM